MNILKYIRLFFCIIFPPFGVFLLTRRYYLVLWATFWSIFYFLPGVLFALYYYIKNKGNCIIIHPSERKISFIEKWLTAYWYWNVNLLNGSKILFYLWLIFASICLVGIYSTQGENISKSIKSQEGIFVNAFIYKKPSELIGYENKQFIETAIYKNWEKRILSGDLKVESYKFIGTIEKQSSNQNLYIFEVIFKDRKLGLLTIEADYLLQIKRHSLIKI
jgi:hypothetical protein